MSTFSEADHPRGGDGKFSRRNLGETDPGFDDEDRPGMNIDTAVDAAGNLSPEALAEAARNTAALNESEPLGSVAPNWDAPEGFDYETGQRTYRFDRAIRVHTGERHTYVAIGRLTQAEKERVARVIFDRVWQDSSEEIRQHHRSLGAEKVKELALRTVETIEPTRDVTVAFTRDRAAHYQTGEYGFGWGDSKDFTVATLDSDFPDTYDDYLTPGE